MEVAPPIYLITHDLSSARMHYTNIQSIPHVRTSLDIEQLQI